MTLGVACKVKEQDGMMLAKVKEHARWDMDDACKSKGTRWDDACKLKVKEQYGIMLANVCKSPKYPYSLHQRLNCYDDVQLTNAESSSYTFYNRHYLSDRVLQNTDTSSYL